MTPLSMRLPMRTALLSGLGAAAVIGVLAAVAAITDEPFVFPSLGATVFLHFASPLAATASPRNTIIGHALGTVAGYLALVVFGLTDAAPALATSVTGPRVGAVALALGVTTAAVVALRCAHPPAGATTLIVALGILREPGDLAVLMAAVAMVTVVAYAVHRVVGIPYPRWRAPAP